MVKSTRRNKPISSIITYQQRDVVKSLTVKGATNLVDFVDDNGHITITVSRDGSKVDTKDFEQRLTELESKITSGGGVASGGVDYETFDKTIKQLYKDMDTKTTHQALIGVQEFLQKQIDELKAQIN